MFVFCICLYVEDIGGDGCLVILIYGWLLFVDVWKIQVVILCDVQYCVISYDWCGFGCFDKLVDGYDYDILVVDLVGVIEECDLCDVILVGFLMGGGEVVCYVVNYGQDCLYSVVFVVVVLLFLLCSDDNLEGLLIQVKVDEMCSGLEKDCEVFFDGFICDFFSVNGQLMVIEEMCQVVIVLCY